MCSIQSFFTTGWLIRQLSLLEYATCYALMRAYITPFAHFSHDELWLVEHPPVYTLGLSCRPTHPLHHGIPVVHTDRGGKITYHGPGQIVLYPLVHLQRRNLSLQQFVQRLEEAIIACLAQWQIVGHTKAGQPGIYVAGKKIASLGLRIRQGCSYHGLALNVNMLLEPFTVIDPCGFPGLHMTHMAHFVPQIDNNAVRRALVHHVVTALDIIHE